MSSRHVVIIGGGLAGITAAIELREAGHEVTLLEARPWLGGATCSFSRGGLAIDNGQHVFLRCCTAYRDLLARLGVTGSVSIQDRFDVTVLSPGGQARLRRSGLPGPLHMAGALARYSFLSPASRLRVARAALAMRFANPARPELDRARLGDWLGARGQRETARRRLWDMFIVSTLNIAGDEANVGLAATVIKTALLGRRDAADIGIPAISLGDLHGKAAAALLGRLGADVQLGAKAISVEPDAAGGFRVRVVSGADDRGGRGPGAVQPGDAESGIAAGGNGGADTAAGVNSGADTATAGSGSADTAAAGGNGSPDATASGAGHRPADLLAGDLLSGDLAGRVLRADAVILAVPASTAARLMPAGQAAAAVSWAGLGTSPIVNVHVIYDRRVTRLPFAAGVDSPVQWVFDKTRQAGLPAGQYLAVSLSAADEYVEVPAARLREQFLPALEDLFPAARDARVTDFFVTRERRATFRQAPGCGALRPGAVTSLRGLVLAGAWTDTGWPDTMEGAVRSGLTAVQAVRDELAAADRADYGASAAPAGLAASAPDRAASAAAGASS
jgi:monoamine oxidase